MISVRRTRFSRILLAGRKQQNGRVGCCQLMVQGCAPATIHRCQLMAINDVGGCNFFAVTRRYNSEYTTKGINKEGVGRVLEEENEDEVIFDDAHETHHENDMDGRGRLWLDPNTSLTSRVNRFVSKETGSLHGLDVTLASVGLIRECGQLGNFEGMKDAHDILGESRRRA